MESQALTTTTAQRQVSPLGRTELEGYEDLGAQDFLVPSWSIVQRSSHRDNADQHFGHLVRNIDGVYAEKLACVILRATPNNTLWASVDAKAPECVSNNGVNGSVFGRCDRCVFNRFANRELYDQLDRGETVKHCNTGGYAYVIFTPEDQGLALFRVHGTGIKPAKLFNVQMRTKRIPIFGAPVILDTVKDSNGKGAFYVPRFTIGTPFILDQITPIREQYLAIKGQVVRDLEPAEEAPADPDLYAPESTDVPELAF